MHLSTNGICAVLFDLDGTLRYNVPSHNQTFFDYAADLGAPDSPEKRRTTQRWIHYYWAQSPELREDVEAYGNLTDEFWNFYGYRILRWFGCEEGEATYSMGAAIQLRMEEEFHSEDRLGEGVLATLETLQAAGFAMGVASNRGKPYDEQIASLGLDKYFAFALAAGSIQSWKPDPEIFLHALNLLGVSPQQTLYVGDNYFADVIGARRAGLHPVLIDPEGVFPDADCPVICSIGELLPLLGN